MSSLVDHGFNFVITVTAINQTSPGRWLFKIDIHHFCPSNFNLFWIKAYYFSPCCWLFQIKWTFSFISASASQLIFLYPSLIYNFVISVHSVPPFLQPKTKSFLFSHYSFVWLYIYYLFNHLFLQCSTAPNHNGWRYITQLVTITFHNALWDTLSPLMLAIHSDTATKRHTCYIVPHILQWQVSDFRHSPCLSFYTFR